MNVTVEQSLISKIRTLSPQQVAEVEDFVEFLAAKSKRRAAIDRLLAIAPALGTAGVEPMSEVEIAAEVKAARAERWYPAMPMTIRSLPPQSLRVRR
jgi:hypothetical protein